MNLNKNLYIKYDINRTILNIKIKNINKKSALHM